MKKFRNVLYQFLIVFIAFSSIRVMAVGEQYIDTYNTLLKGIQDRGGLTSNQPKQQGDSVTQGDLNILRGAVTSLAKNFFVIDGGPGPFGTETEANAIFKPLYYKDTKGTPDISDDEWKFTTLDRDFIKVPAKYTKLKKNIISNSFTDVPVLWQHFTDMTTVLNAMELKKITLSISVDVAKNNTEWWIRECCYIGSEYYDSWFRLLPEDGGYLEWAMLAFSSASYTKTDMPLPDIFKERVKADHFLTLSSSSTINNVSEFKQYFLRYTHGTSIDNSYMWIIDNKSLGQEISLENSLPPEMMGEPPAQMWDSNNYNYYKEIIAHWFFAKLNVSSVSISNPSQTMDSSNNDVVLAGCVTCKLGESFIKQFNDAGMSAQFPTGMSSGFDSGLIVFSYLTNYKLGDFKYSHHSLNTSIMADYNGTEPDGNKWQFTLIQRPRGAQVLMGWINWSGDIPDKAEAINGGGYDLKVRNSERIIKFSDNVVHVFPSGTGALVRCEKMVDDELLKVTPPGSSLSITGGNNPTEVTSWGLLKSKPTYNTDGTCSAVYYYVVVAGYDIPFAKFTVEYTTQTLAQRSIPDVYYVADASALINASLFATDPPPAQEVEVQVYRYYKYIDGAYVLQSETKNSVDENGNPTSEEYNVDNGSTTSVAQKTTYSKLESTDPRVTINQKTVTEGTNTFVTISKEKAFPWGNEVIENIEGFGTANEKTTVYTYGENEYITPPDPADPTVIPVLDPSYGKIKSIQYPDGSWIRNEYDSEGRTIKEITPIGNAAIDASENLCKVTEYDYTAYVTGDTVETGDFRPRLVVTKKLGFEISRSYQGFLDHEHRSIECQTAGAAWNATDNLVTYKYSYPDGHAFAGRHWKTVYPDGTMSITSYAKTTDTFTTTVDRGAGSGDTVTDGVRSISAMNTKGWTTSSQTVDIASGLAISSATYQHDDYGRVTRTDYADGTYTTTAYACCGPSQRVNREGTATDIMYDALKRVINRETDGIATLYSYDADGNVLTTTLKGRLGTEKTTTNTYNDAGELVSKTTPDNKTTTYSESWVDGVRYSTTTYPNNTTQITKYNLDGTVAETYGTAVRHVKYEYGVENGEQYTKTINVGENGSETNWTKTYINFSGKAYKTVTSSGATTLTEFDSLGRAVKKTAPNGVITLTEYNTKGEACASAVDMNQNGVIDYAGTDRVTGIERVYESKNGTVVSKQTQSVYATDSSATPTVTSVSENAVDGSASWQTSFGNVTSSQTVLSGSGQKTITVTNPDNSTVTTVYLNGRMTSSTHSVLGTTTYTYDEFNRTSTITHAEDGVDKVTTYAYNAAGQVESITLSSGTESKVTSYTYDDMGRRTSATLPGGRTVNYTYAPTGELLTVSGADTYPQTYTYDPLGRMKTLLTYRTYPGTADTTTWNYDPSSGFMTSKVYANGKGTTYTYNNAGQLATRLWARGITTTYGYDNGGAKNSIDYSDTTTDISFTYDRLGRTKTVTDAAGTRTNTYDANLRLTSSTIPNILNTKLEYAYDSLGRMSSMKLMEETV